MLRTLCSLLAAASLSLLASCASGSAPAVKLLTIDLPDELLVPCQRPTLPADPLDEDGVGALLLAYDDALAACGGKIDRLRDLEAQRRR